MSKRINFGKLKEVITPPNLIQNQIDSFMEFLQMGVPANKRQNAGLEAVFRELFPIESYDGRCTLEYISYKLIEPKTTEMECIKEGITYAVSLYVNLRLKEEDSVKEEEIYLGEFPMITKSGSFIINGAERVVVSQLHRSPGISFEESAHTSGKILYAFRIIPDRGTWLELQFDQNDLPYVYLDRRRRRRKFLVSTLLRAFGYSSDIEILKLFYDIQDVSVAKVMGMENVSHYLLIEDIVDAERGIVLARAFEPLTKTTLKTFEKAGVKKIQIIDTQVDDGAIIRSLKKDNT
ncbi:MAG: DNA-directed RNA polymerase subunit beta, partial [Verrucomicrobia bacterium]